MPERSTKAGAFTPATPHAPPGALRRPTRSTKAGAFTPATRRAPGRSRGGSGALNEGRGVHPGDTSASSADQSSPARLAQRRPGRSPRRHSRTGSDSTRPCPPLNEGRGVHPGDTCAPRPSSTRRDPLNEGRGVHPGDTCAPRPSSTRRDPLNEGRGVHPGDTSRNPSSRAHASSAQRRPGRSPRRHRQHSRGRDTRLSRSTKAGAFTPATPATARATAWPRRSAQRRPGRSPRRHVADNVAITLQANAQRRPGRSPRRHAFHRRQRRPGRSLNEGRGVHPGDTPTPAAIRRRFTARSTKAGAFTPATLDRELVVVLAVDRSTKAGAFTPATPPRAARAAATWRSLNEGRGVHPGDTANATEMSFRGGRGALLAVCS